MALFTRDSRLYDSLTNRSLRLAGVSVQDPLWQRLSPGPRMLPHGPLNLEMAAKFGANAVRIPFHPVTIRHAGNQDWDAGLAAASAELDWILLAAKALNLLVTIDFHAIGFPADESTFEFDEAPYKNLYAASTYEIESFWRHIARRFGSHPQVAAFELFNEATRDAAFGNAQDWDLHATWAEDLLRDVIRPLAPHTLAIVGGLHFGYDLEGALDRPVRDHCVAYSSHPYPHHSQAKSWDHAFGSVAKRLPVILTEVGFSADGFFGRHHHRGFRDWELELRSYADQLGLSFFAWNFSTSWEPALLQTADFVPNEAGLFFQDWMKSTS